MTVNELRELLSKYDGDREVVLAGILWREIAGLRSVEPGGHVFLFAGGLLSNEYSVAAESTP